MIMENEINNEKGDYENAVAKVVFYTIKDHPKAAELNISEQTKKIIESDKYSPETVIGLSRAMEDWKIHPETPQELNEESIKKSINQVIDQYNNNPSISSKYRIENIVEYAEERDLKIPKSQIEKMRLSLEEKKETVDSLIVFVGRVAEKQEQKGLGWYRAEEPVKKQPLLKYQDQKDVTRAYIIERERRDNEGKFYAAYRIDEKNKAVQLKTSGNVEVLKSNIGAYYTGITMNEIHVEMLKEYAQKKDLNVPLETQEKWKGLLEKGEKKDKIVRYIDGFAGKNIDKANGNPPVEKDKAPSKEKGLDI